MVGRIASVNVSNGGVPKRPVPRAWVERLGLDTDGQAACKVRKATMERLAGTDTLCFPAHFRRTSAGHVKRDGDAFRYEWIDNN